MWIKWMRPGLTFILLIAVFFGNAQDNEEVQLADEYLRQGESDKAIEIYSDLARNIRNIPLIHDKYFDLLIDLRKYDDAQDYLSKVLKRFPGNIDYSLDQGLLYKRQGLDDKADAYFQRFIRSINQENYKIRYSAQYFISKQLPEYSIMSYQEGRKAMRDPFLYSLEMANMYRIMNKKEEMVNEYLNFVTQNPSNLNYVKNTLQNLLTEPEEFENLETILYSKIQDDPNNSIYGELLIWVNLQQKNFYGAFLQARALDKRLRNEGEKSLNIGLIALKNKDYRNSIRIFEYIIETYPGSFNFILARLYVIKSREEMTKNTFPVAIEEIEKLINDYEQFISQTGINRTTLEAYRNQAMLYAFYMDDKEKAISILKQIINSPRSIPEFKAQCKINLGDIHLLNGQPWESTLLYSQVEKEQKETPVGYEAKLKNAKLSYYKGEFALAQEHLDILEMATTREISNDAMALSVLINDNTILDTTDFAMQQYASIDLLLFQNKNDEAAAKIDEMLITYEGHSLTDELFWLKSDILMKSGDFQEALDLLKKIVEEYDYDILSDDAYFRMGEIYEVHLNNKEEAMKIYRDFLTRYPGSIYVSESRKRFRMLRGDFHNLDVN